MKPLPHQQFFLVSKEKREAAKVELKPKLSAEIADQTREFYAQGGKVQVIPAGFGSQCSQTLKEYVKSSGKIMAEDKLSWRNDRK